MNKRKLTVDLIRLQMPILAFLTEEELVKRGLTTEDIAIINIEKKVYLEAKKPEFDRVEREIAAFDNSGIIERLKAAGCSPFKREDEPDRS